eukprot:Nitzschia sp. Nitz4//scaffold216_size36101//31917//35797//NITZ4_007786-RA/size36101-snap-gene-0.13-mRNA-1//1//CDS//3329542209//4256//frame0
MNRLDVRSLAIHEGDVESQSTSNPDEESNHESKSASNDASNSEDDVSHLKQSLTKRETEQVFRLRVLVIAILFAAAGSVSFTIYKLTHNSEVDEFKSQYYSVAEKIIESFQETMVQISAVSGLAVAATAHSQDANEVWPFITLSNFQERAGSAIALSGAVFLSISPLVQTEELALWEEYVRSDENAWIDEGLSYQQAKGLNDFHDPAQVDKTWLTLDKVDPIHSYSSAGKPQLSQTSGPFLPQWQTSPVLQSSVVNENLFEEESFASIVRDCIENEAAVLGGFVMSPAGNVSSSNMHTAFFATIQSIAAGRQKDYQGDPMSHLVIPIFDKLTGTDRTVMAVLRSTIHWTTYLNGILPSTVKGVTVVIKNECDGYFTYSVEGADASVVGEGDLHDSGFDAYMVEGNFLTETITDGTLNGLQLNQEGCPYSFRVYPTNTFHDLYITSNPQRISIAVAVVFLFTILMFFAYDYLVERRQRLILAKATQSTAIVSSLFPKQVRDRLLAGDLDKRKSEALMGPQNRVKSYLSGSNNNDQDDQVIADLFPHCTVFFGDISGFTAWSSTREPAQVFVLLQAVYGAFDVIAKRRRVFKVETIGDSYVAVAGLPEPQPNHALIMAKFCWECLLKIRQITSELESTLGPDTGELSMRFGLHSGPVTGGVLKGDRARFQLFGDTVNTASRMESTGRAGRIQVSNSTATLLRTAGKETWLTKREDLVEAKGKGVLNTFWLALGNLSSKHSSDIDDSSVSFPHARIGGHSIKFVEGRSTDLKQNRLVDWISDILLDDIKKVIAVRERCFPQEPDDDLVYEQPEGSICLDETKEAINMPEFKPEVMEAMQEATYVHVPDDMSNSVKEYVSLIANSYRGNSFHNFEHACHVTMSVHKLLTRVVAPEISAKDITKLKDGREQVAAHIHNFTHGITSDPMAGFAITFSALIHDVDHQGISNIQLMKEEPEMAKLYRNKSCAEQNSLDVAWDILMSERFEALRRYIFGTKSEMMRFRQLIVNIVLATDIFDKELGALRKDRWQRAFQQDSPLSEAQIGDLRATIVIEHIIQASDVSHTMQHWHVYQKWNRKLFGEMHYAWTHGRMGADPKGFWYESELKFFDNYVIPLAKKLKECNVFGVSSDEYLNYAVNNRAEWEERGQEILEEMCSALEEDAKEHRTSVQSVNDTESSPSTSESGEETEIV